MYRVAWRGFVGTARNGVDLDGMMLDVLRRNIRPEEISITLEPDLPPTPSLAQDLHWCERCQSMIPLVHDCN